MQDYNQTAVLSMSEDEGQILSLADNYTKSDIRDVAQGYQVGRNIIWPEAPINNGKFVSLVPGGISQTSDAPAFDPGLRININPGGNDMGILFLLMETQMYDHFVDDTGNDDGNGDPNPPDTGAGG